MATTAEKNAFKAQIAADEANRSVTIGTFNINKYVKQSPEPIQKAMHIAMEKGIGIIGVQEYCEFWNLPESTSKIAGVYDHVGKQRILDLSWGSGWQGNAVVSTFGLSTKTGGVYSALGNGEQPRGYVKVIFNTSYKNVSLYNTHFSQNGNTYVRKHAQELANVIKNDKNYYKVITGDFNSYSEYDLKPLLELGFKPVFPFTSKQIDNILAPEYMTVLDKNSVQDLETITDHNLYYATLRFD
ncbi:endonuclease/exonuclease/phosphatase family protein [Clostridioides sp. GD02377]|uniref:endonuclease/exonuclease/phosphatase family protein n=1 Tax=unclassified Clostridioides TaxID=2635829 RepID=UPI0038B105EE